VLASRSFLDSTKFFASLDGPPHPYKTTGAFAYERFPEEALQIIVGMLDTAPTPQCGLWMQSFGGAFAAKRPDETAFFHRKAQFILEYVGAWSKEKIADRELAQKCHDWAKAFRQKLSPYTTGTYVNFIDLDLTQDEYLKLYYGDNAPRLREIKARVDPANLFNFEQSIPPMR